MPTRLNPYGRYKSLSRVKGVTDLRIVNCYDVENIDRELFDYCSKTVFSEPQLDNICDSVDFGNAVVFAVEFLPGQFDQRADSAAQCIQIISQKDKPIVKTMKIYAVYGDISEKDTEKIKKYVINPVEAREASLEKPETLSVKYDIPTEVAVLHGFTQLDENGLKAFIAENGLAMDFGDIAFVQNYFKNEKRDPSITEIKVIDTYWSDHCRHTTFLTTIDSVDFEDELVKAAYDEYMADREAVGDKKKVCLMDIATVAVKGSAGKESWISWISRRR